MKIVSLKDRRKSLTAVTLEDGRELLLEVSFQRIGRVQAVYETVHDICLLLGEVDQVLEIYIRTRHLAQLVYIAVQLLDDKSAFLEGVDVPVDGSVGSTQLLCQFIDRIVHIAGHHLHETKQAFYLWLVHIMMFYCRSLLSTKNVDG